MLTIDTAANPSLPHGSQAGSSFPPATARAVCAVCEQLRVSEHDFPVNGAERPEDIALAREAIVDAIGFCEDHGAALLRQGDCHALARILGDATDCILGWLGDEKRYADRMLEVFFAVGRACPTCKLQGHRLTHHVRRLAEGNHGQPGERELCFSHYRDVANTVSAATLLVLANGQRKLLEAVIGEIGRIPEEPCSDSDCLPIAPETLRWASRMVASEVALVDKVSDAERGIHVVTTEGGDRDRDSCDDETSCPVCAGIQREEARWLEMTKTVARLGHDLWTVLPTCAKHIQQCARCDDEDVALAATRYAAEVQLASLRDGIAALVQDDRNREVARKSVFYRRKSPAYVLGQQRKMVTNLPRCPACERLVVAQDRGIMEALQRLRPARRGTAGEYFARFCLKHFGAVYVYTMPGEVRSWLVGIQMQRFGELRTHLAQAADRGDATALEHAVRQTMRAWRTAMW
jgi:hypothetical protein